MSLIKNIKNGVKKVTDKLPELTDEAVDKLKKAGEAGIEKTKEVMHDVGDKVADLAAPTRLKSEIEKMKQEQDEKLNRLGRIFYAYSKDQDNAELTAQLEETLGSLNLLRAQITAKTLEYDNIQKERSEKYVVQKLSNELSEAGAIIDQTIVSEKSTMVGKLLKEITLPKEALITVVKRGEDVIIPDGNAEILPGDLVTVSGIESDVQKVIKRLHGGKK